MSKRLRICAAAELPSGQRRVVRIDKDEEVLVLNVAGTLYAINNICPHASAPFERGDVIEDVLYCPLHRWGFELATGMCLDDDRLCAQTYVVDVRDGDVWLVWPDISGQANC